MRLGLARVRQLLSALGNPQLAVPTVLVAGTNGKGSTAALLASMCRAAGARTGLFTSPHLEALTERLSLDGRPISDRALAAAIERALGGADALDCQPPTYFEALAIAAFGYFAEQRADLAIVEVGLGGRLDATNVCEPVLSLITSISLDHEQHLGTTPAAVAREKAGILRRGKPAIAWAGTAAVERALRQQARASGADLVFADSTEITTSTPAGASPQQVRLRTGRRAYGLELHLAGHHQARNLAVAVLAAETLGGGAWPSLDETAITRGARACRWPGRLEWVDLGDGRRVLLDAAHNAAGIEALTAYLAARKPEQRPDLLFGALAEKQISAALPLLAAQVGKIVVTRPPGERAAEPDHWLPAFEGHEVHAEADLSRALEAALRSAGDTLLVCGSIYLIGAVRTMLRKRYGRPS